jgi:hypothetical protein
LSNNNTVYTGPSPDEEAFVNFAKFMGFEYVGNIGNETNLITVFYSKKYFLRSNSKINY